MARSITGKVSSAGGSKTIVVGVAIRRTHPLYKKQYTTHYKFMAHDEKNEAKVGDIVIIEESRPLSAKKHFRLQSILEKADIRFEESDATADITEPQNQEKAS